MVAVNDGVVKKIGRNTKLGRYVVLQDVYGNQYTYARPRLEVAAALPGPEDRQPPSGPTTALLARERPSARPAPPPPGAQPTTRRRAATRA